MLQEEIYNAVAGQAHHPQGRGTMTSEHEYDSLLVQESPVLRLHPENLCTHPFQGLLYQEHVSAHPQIQDNRCQ